MPERSFYRWKKLYEHGHLWTQGVVPAQGSRPTKRRYDRLFERGPIPVASSLDGMLGSAIDFEFSRPDFGWNRGDIWPSVRLTSESDMREAGHALGVPLVDHLIVGGAAFHRFRTAEGWA